MIISRDKKLLCPPFAKILDEFEKRLAVQGLPFHLFMGLRTPEDQQELWEQGRLTPGKIVTNARGLPIPDSYHCYGLAADYVLDGMPEKPGIQWSWNTKVDINADGRSDWYEMGELARACGLEWGGAWKRFPDFPHVQNRFGYTLPEIKEFYRQGGVRNVWAQCT